MGIPGALLYDAMFLLDLMVECYEWDGMDGGMI